MNAYKTNSAEDIVYIDHSTSGTGSSISQSSADPASLATFMRNTVIIISHPLDEIIDIKKDENTSGKEKTAEQK
jgi:hypothetical protein